ncbi:Os01g0632700 [Oryza sativa Japonica Group]|uniref:Os01g0632700 protein n=1 Tax=Oryza sativa subsp. japonica TaxID=39947 RepID=A0A0P0V5R3_ORYSJ|nr:Os01g0632700 [Oryza sativa Japonica Group]
MLKISTCVFYDCLCTVLVILLFYASIPTFPESPNLQEKILKSSKVSKANHIDPKQPFEHVDPV